MKTNMTMTSFALSALLIAGCNFKNNGNRQSDLSTSSSVNIEKDLSVPYEEIIFTEEEVMSSFDDPTEYGSEVFSAVYVPSNQI